MPIALAMLFGGTWLVISGWKGWTVSELFKDDRPPSKPFASKKPTYGVLTAGDPGTDNSIGGFAQDSAALVGGAITLRKLADLAANTYGLSVREYEPYDHVERVHAPGSYHYKGRAFDASGPRMSQFANAIDRQYGSSLTELFWNGPNPVNRKNGKRVRRGFVIGHTDHVHVAI